MEAAVSSPKDTHAWNAAFWAFAAVENKDDENQAATLDAWALKQALDAAGFKLSDGQIVDVLMSLGQDAGGALDFATFLQLCTEYADLADLKQERERETKAAFQAVGGGEEGEGKVDKNKIKEVLDAFEIQLDASGLVTAADSNQDGGVDYDEFAAFLRSANEDIDLDSNLHSSGVQWLRRDVTDVRQTHKTAQIKQRTVPVNTTRRRTTMYETDEVATSSATDPFSRLKWLEKLQLAMNARQKADMQRQQERHKELNAAAATRGSQKSLGGSLDTSTASEPENYKSPAQKKVSLERTAPSSSKGSKTTLRHEKFEGGAHRKEHHAQMAAIKGKKA